MNSRQRRKISRNLKKIIDREKNGLARLLQELKKGIRAKVESRRVADMNSEDNETSNEHTKYAFHWYSDVRGTVFTHVTFPGVFGTRRIIENSFLCWNDPETIFRICVVPCLLVFIPQ